MESLAMSEKKRQVFKGEGQTIGDSSERKGKGERERESSKEQGPPPHTTYSQSLIHFDENRIACVNF